MMFRISDAILVIAVVVGAVWTYQIKHEADLSAKRLASLKSQIAAQNRKITLLEADWAIETSPERLERVAKQYEAQLELKPMESSQIIDLTELPGFRPEPKSEDAETWAAKDHDTLTGGIGALIKQAGEKP